ncbi:MAG TPA: AraC family transcriptional regulator, partial [Pseudomonas sp.]|nr:AraC family transcriptional regulator [Pseudomonas sp.]
MGRYLPAETRLTELPMPTQDVVLQLFSHRSVEVPIGVPAVVEPLLVLVLAGA